MAAGIADEPPTREDPASESPGPAAWAGHAARQGALTLLSRITGFLRDGVIAYFLGTSALADAYYFAFRIPNLFRRLLGEGAMAVAVIPVFTEYEKEKSQAERNRFVRATAGLLAAALLLIVGAGIYWAPKLAGGAPGMVDRAFSSLHQALGFSPAPGAADAPFDAVLATRLIRWFFPYLFFAGLAALAQGCLNAAGIFGLPAATPIWLNFSLITGALTAHLLGQPILGGLVIGVLVGGCGQLLMLFPALKRQGISLWPIWAPGHPGVRRVLRRWLPGLWGASIYQVMIYCAGRFAAGAGQSTVSGLYYAGRVSEVAYGVVVVSASSALLPAMARQAQAGDYAALRATLRAGLRWLGFLLTPAAALLIFFAGPLVALLLQRGEFNAASVAATALPAAIFAAGLLAQAGMRIFLAGCHAVGDTRRPAFVATAAFVVFFVAAELLTPRWGGAGIAAAIVLGTLLNMIGLAFVCRAHFGGFGGLRALVAPLALTLGCGIVSAALARLAFDAVSAATGHSRIWVAPCLLMGGAGFLLMTRLLRIAESAEFLAQARKLWGRAL